jgi:hypothetical protein
MTMYRYFNRAAQSIVLAYLLVSSIVLPGTAQSDIDKNTCRDDNDNRKEAVAIAATNRRASRQQDRIIIKTARKYLVFRDNCKGGLFVVYTLKAYYQDLDYFLVFASGNEWEDYTLVNGKNASRTGLLGEPIFSPDRQRFVSTVIDEMNGTTSIYIYRIDAMRVKIEYRNIDKWRPSNVAWRGNSSIEFDHNPRSKLTTTRVKLERKNRVWVARLK